MKSSLDVLHAVVFPVADILHDRLAALAGGSEGGVHPLPDAAVENGDYTVSVLENTTGSKYAQVLAAKFKVSLADEFAPFLRPNQYVNYAVAANTTW